MSFATVRDAIKTRLEGVALLGKVFGYEPWSRDNPESTAFKAAFTENNILNVAWIDQLDRREPKVPEDDDREKVHRDWRISLIYAFGRAGASSEDFEAIVDAICVAFNAPAADRKLGGVCVTHTRITVRGIRLTMYMGKDLVHFAQLEFTTEEVV